MRIVYTPKDTKQVERSQQVQSKDFHLLFAPWIYILEQMEQNNDCLANACALATRVNFKMRPGAFGGQGGGPFEVAYQNRVLARSLPTTHQIAGEFCNIRTPSRSYSPWVPLLYWSVSQKLTAKTLAFLWVSLNNQKRPSLFLVS